MTLTIYSIDGTIVRTLRLGRLDPGDYTSRTKAAYWDGRNELGERVASGLYFYRIEAGTWSSTRRLVIMK